jgi:hypothetical protein
MAKEGKDVTAERRKESSKVNVITKERVFMQCMCKGVKQNFKTE